MCQAQFVIRRMPLLPGGSATQWLTSVTFIKVDQLHFLSLLFFFLSRVEHEDGAMKDVII